MSEEKIKDMILKQCLELTTNNDLRPPISAYNGVDIDDVVKVYKQLQDKKTYLDIVKENESLKKENKILRENAENNDKVVDKVNWENQLLKKENEQLKDNWNKLKEYCKENTLCYEVGDDENTKLIGSKIHGLNVLDKMQELEQGSDK